MNAIDSPPSLSRESACFSTEIANAGNTLGKIGRGMLKANAAPGMDGLILRITPSCLRPDTHRVGGLNRFALRSRP
jgi:hypothetical protein